MLWSRYGSVFHPEINKIAMLPYWSTKIIAAMTHNEGLKYNTVVMAYYEKFGEPGDPTEANRILGAPTTGHYKVIL